MILAHGIKVLVPDGTHMILMVNDGNPEVPALRVMEHWQFSNPPNRDLLEEAPGLNLSRGHPGRNTMERSNPHQENEAGFIVSAAERIDRAIGTDTANLIVVAPPRVLGKWRRVCSDRLRKRIVGEIAKDLTKHPINEIARLVAASEIIDSSRLQHARAKA